MNTISQTADGGGCRPILDKIDFLIKVQHVADGVDQVEPLFEDLVDRIKESADCRPDVLTRFSGLVADIDAWTLEMLEYCMHDLRWPEVRELTRAAMDRESRVDRRRLYERLLRSFDDDWPDRDFYRRYSA